MSIAVVPAGTDCLQSGVNNFNANDVQQTRRMAQKLLSNQQALHDDLLAVGNPTMLVTTILVDETPVCVVRPIDRKDLERFIRNGKRYLLADNLDGRITHRDADQGEVVKWHKAVALHKAWGGDEEGFFGLPL